MYSNNLYLFICIQAKNFLSTFKKNLIKFKKLIICINPTLTLIKNLTQVILFLAWITGMDLATSSGLLLTTSEDGYVRQGGGGHSLQHLHSVF
jgi:hypothetical protein